MDPVEALMAQARESGLRVIILEPGADAASAFEAAPAGADLGARAAEITGRTVARLHQVIANAPHEIDTLPAVLAAFSPNGSPVWPAQVAGVALLGLILGHILFRGLRRLVSLPPPDPVGGSVSRTSRLRVTVGKAFLAAIGVALEIAFGLLLPVIVVGDGAPTRTVVSVVIGNALPIRLGMVFFRSALAPETGATRAIPMSDSAAYRLWSHLRFGLFAIFALATPALLVLELEVGQDLKALSAIVGTGVAALVLILVAVLNRTALEELGTNAAGRSNLFLARKWWALAVAYIGLAWLMTSVRWLVGLPHALGLVAAPLLAAMLAVSLYALSLIVIDRIANRARGGSAAAGEAEQVPGQETGQHWADRTALVFALAVAALYVLDVWGVDFRRPDGRVGLVPSAVLTICLGYAAWAAVCAWFERKITEEGGAVGPVEVEEGGGAGASRLATLLPLFRNIILSAIIAVAAMLLLLEAGVNIAPLFAGAGILGLAIGFGAQTLIRDIFSGLFFLIDDAFRVGEYIETGTVKGTVERISIRSMQLRHQNGPLHTIPFGEIQQLTNYSRDWVIMKLPLRVTLDTDPERVRKLVKKLGQELLTDPQVGPKFLEPLKSQGVLSIDNFGMVIRVKFMTRPGEQFVTRRVVYHRIHELFEHEGIEFASRDVRVRVDQTAQGDPRAAQVAAALEATEAVEPGGAGDSQGDER